MLEKLCDLLEVDEGWREYVYDDATGEPIVPGYTVKGHPTIGFGCCVEKGIAGLPKDIGKQWLQFAVSYRWWRLCSRHDWLMEQPEEVQIALGSMAYQLGVDGVCGFPNMLAALKAGDRALAAEHALDSDWARFQTPARATRVAAMIRG